MTERWIESNHIHSGRIFSVRVGQAQLDDGSIVQREVVEHPGGVAVIPVLDNRSIILIRQFRISIGRQILEIPGGRIENNEDPQHRALRELEEEIGYQAHRIIPVARCYSAPGFTNLKIHIFLAFDLHRTQQDLEWDEDVQLVKLPFGEVKEMLLQGQFEDANTIIGLHYLLAYFRDQSDTM